MLKARTDAFIDTNFQRETEFLAELVKVPSDNPPGDCAPIALQDHDADVSYRNIWIRPL